MLPYAFEYETFTDEVEPTAGETDVSERLIEADLVTFTVIVFDARTVLFELTAETVIFEVPAPVPLIFNGILLPDHEPQEQLTLLPLV